LEQALTGTDPDRLVEEKQRGLTIDLGFAWTTLPSAGAVEFVDVPGHVRFIANMLAGVAVIGCGLLCVDAREGWRPQTEEHLRILDLIGVPAGLVALTKVGLVPDARIAACRDEVAERVAGTVLEGAPVVACDAIAGIGMDELRTELADLLAAQVRAGDHDRPRLWIDRSFTIAGAGTVVTGGLSGGGVAVGDRVEVVGTQGRSEPFRVRGIQALGRPVERAPAGTRAALNLAGAPRKVARRGDALVRVGEWPGVRQVDATLTVLPALEHDVTGRGAYLAYVGTGEHAVRLRLLEPRRLAPGTTGEVRLTFGHELPLAVGDRYVLRETGRAELVGGGTVCERRKPAEPAGDAALRERIERVRPVGLAVAALAPEDVTALARLQADGSAEVVAGYAVAPAWRDELSRHPAVLDLARQGFAPEPGRLPPDLLRVLVLRGHVVGKDGVYFARSTRDAAVDILSRLAGEDPGGFTVGQACRALGTSRKWGLPLLQVLDGEGVTVRRGDRRTVRPDRGPDRRPGRGSG
jgi:selenocysteine-specific elongation factor